MRLSVAPSVIRTMGHVAVGVVSRVHGTSRMSRLVVCFERLTVLGPERFVVLLM